MTNMSREARALLKVARSACEPTDAHRARVWASLSAAVASSTIAASTASAASAQGSSAAASTATAGLAAKLTTAIVCAAVGVGTVYSISESRPQGQTPVPASEERRVGAPPASEIGLAPKPPAMIVVAETTIRNQPQSAPTKSSPAPDSLPVQRPAKKPRPKADVSPRHEVRSLADELTRIRAVRSALDDGAAQRAFTRLTSYFSDYPEGVLHQEAAALEVRALCALGRNEQATRAADEFQQRWPQSPLRWRLGESCSADDVLDTVRAPSRH